jgi:hypothetical protein
MDWISYLCVVVRLRCAFVAPLWVTPFVNPHPTRRDETRREDLPHPDPHPTINNQQSTINNQQSTINNQQSTTTTNKPIIPPKKKKPAIEPWVPSIKSHAQLYRPIPGKGRTNHRVFLALDVPVRPLEWDGWGGF